VRNDWSTLQQNQKGGGRMARRSRRLLFAIGLLSAAACFLVPSPVASAAPASESPGYWLAGADGGVFAFDAPFYGSGALHPDTPGQCAIIPGELGFLGRWTAPATTLGCTAIAATKNGEGYWLLNSWLLGKGYGGAGLYDGCQSIDGSQTGSWTGVASSDSSSGYWMVSSNGGVYGCGDAGSPYGDLTLLHLNLDKPPR
jgi:hypothetical protein